jgi:hypothetical protein
MTVTAAYIIDRRRQVKILVICRFHAANEGTEVGQIPDVEEEKIFFRHDIMIALFWKVIAESRFL